MISLALEKGTEGLSDCTEIQEESASMQDSLYQRKKHTDE